MADTFDAIVNDRPYRLAASMEEAVEEMKAHRRTQFDPDVLDAFLQLVASGELSEGMASADGVQ